MSTDICAHPRTSISIWDIWFLKNARRHIRINGISYSLIDTDVISHGPPGTSYRDITGLIGYGCIKNTILFLFLWRHIIDTNLEQGTYTGKISNLEDSYLLLQKWLICNKSLQGNPKVLFSTSFGSEFQTGQSSWLLDWSSWISDIHEQHIGNTMDL